MTQWENSLATFRNAEAAVAAARERHKEELDPLLKQLKVARQRMQRHKQPYITDEPPEPEGIDDEPVFSYPQG